MTQNESGDSPFSFVIPTEFVELPSKGRYYAENHPLHNAEVVEIKHMTAKEEDLLTSQALLKKGVALERVMKNLVVNKRINPQSLLTGDRNALMIAARISGYGADYTPTVKCPSCNASQETYFNLHDVAITEGETKAELGVKETEDGHFTVRLPKTKCEVTFRLLNGSHEKILLQQVENARKRKKEEQTITRQLSLITVAVNGNDSPEAIEYFVNNVPSIDALHLRTVYKLATPNVDLTQTFSCENCGHEQDMEVPLTADFFWPNR
jgi:hypothetical protein